jgi:hypothetical protein
MLLGIKQERDSHSEIEAKYRKLKTKNNKYIRLCQ